MHCIYTRESLDQYFARRVVATKKTARTGKVTKPKAAQPELGSKPASGFGMVKVAGPALSADFDVASLLGPVPPVVMPR